MPRRADPIGDAAVVDAVARPAVDLDTPLDRAAVHLHALRVLDEQGLVVVAAQRGCRAQGGGGGDEGEPAQRHARRAPDGVRSTEYHGPTACSALYREPGVRCREAQRGVVQASGYTNGRRCRCHCCVPRQGGRQLRVSPHVNRAATHAHEAQRQQHGHATGSHG